jgi:hypothetical protein
MLLQQKYLKYKNKYLNLKNQIGGTNQIGGNIQSVFDTLITRINPDNKCLVKKNGTIEVGYLLPFNNDYYNNNFKALDNPKFKDWCNCIVGGEEYNEEHTTKTCDELWPLFLKHFEDLATFDKADNFDNEPKNLTKIIRRWTEYFNKTPQAIDAKIEINDENNLKSIFCTYLKKVVKDTIQNKASNVSSTYPLHYYFYSQIRNFK